MQNVPPLAGCVAGWLLEDLAALRKLTLQVTGLKEHAALQLSVLDWSFFVVPNKKPNALCVF